MNTRRMMRFLLIALAASGLYGQTDSKQTVTEFMGRKVTITEPELDEFGGPGGPASVCFEGSTKPQCYSTPRSFGLSPTLARLDLGKGREALLFSAVEWFGAASATNFALLRPDGSGGVQNLLRSDLVLSNEGRQTFWREAALSDAPIFVTAEAIWGFDENHYGEHRYMISAYVMRAYPLEEEYYNRDDQYMTARKYNLVDDKVDILNSEKREILARLRRVKAVRERQAKARR